MGKNPIAVLITDTHLDEDNFDLVSSAHKQAIKLAKSLGLCEVYHAGDHFESRTSQSLAILLGMKKIISLYEKEKMDLVTIAGNHDKTDQSVSDSYIDIFTSRFFHNVDGRSIEVEGIDFHFLSYYEEGEYQKRLMKLRDEGESDRRVLITHYGVDGVLNNDENQVESSIRTNSFDFYDQVFIGHYHNASNPSNSVHYIGSTDPRNFGEDDSKGATVIYDDLSFTQEKFEFKSYKKITVEDLSFEKIEDVIEQYKDEDVHLKLEFVGERDKLIKVDKKKLKEAGILCETVDTTLINVDGAATESEKTIGMEKKDILKHLGEYSKQNKIPNKNLAKIIKKF